MDQIDGVYVKQLKINSDDRGFLTELFKADDEFVKKHNIVVKQTNFSVAYPGLIKAFHWHKKQWDIWFIASGNVQVVLHDMREKSPTYKKTQVIFAGETNRVLIAIPPFVAHGYRVLGNEPAALFYHVTETYDPKNPDEERIPHNDPKIGFDWTTKFK